jgi:outer membrane protein assembly factor BamB
MLPIADRPNNATISRSRAKRLWQKRRKSLTQVFRILAFCLPLLVSSGVSSSPLAAQEWGHFRGTKNNPVCKEAGFPDDFDRQEHVLWRVPLPGPGPSSPIVLGDLVVVTCADGVNQSRLHVLAFDRATGRIAWHRTVRATGATIFHPFGGVASNTPAGDGECIVAMFSSNDVVCFDRAGNLLWFRGLGYDYPEMRNDVGMASSPIIVGDTVIIQCENQGTSLLLGLDRKTGRTIWKKERMKDAIWSSPSLLEHSDVDGNLRKLVLIHGRDGLSVVDPQEGKTLYHYEISVNTMASSVSADGAIYLPANGIHKLAIDPDNQELETLWYERRLRGSSPSPAIDDEKMYILKPPGIVVCADTETGRMRWQVRLEGNFWATPVVAGDRLIAVDDAGKVQVVDLEKERGEKVGAFELDGQCLATPAVTPEAVYFRTKQSLWKVSTAP